MMWCILDVVSSYRHQLDRRLA